MISKNIYENKAPAITLGKGWEVPAYDICFWNGKTKDFCIIIPVINEGKRIIALLQEMATLKIANLADIIIVDGGSTDNSLEKVVLGALNVKGLLLKTDIGGLGSQLRCGYAFALKHGYKGIVTIDGNNKDNPNAIQSFIQALIDGVDFVQASRFIPGGIEENTPILRRLAIRLIHAPLLSLTSGFKWTDTTQGFRGYSRRLLLDKDISIFRNIFCHYELLAYLSYIAPKLGFKCKELPTERRYPKGKIPTKISTVRGNLLLIWTLIRACCGGYNISKLSKSTAK